MIRGLLYASVLLCFSLNAGCHDDPSKGWSSKSIFTNEVKTVSVPIAINTTQYRQIGFLLTDAVIKEIESRTPWKVTYASRADTVLNMTVKDVNLKTISLSDVTGLNEEMVVSLTIDFDWEDLETNQVIFSRREFSAGGLFVPSQPSGETLQVGEFQVIQQMATDIVDEMAGSW
ncbi:MAG: LPS assembly lipoprotein LptE [Planctomycetota bacterium]|nr:LPS assembly lipoprotein LptE [Planctomycetota bacterium]